MFLPPGFTFSKLLLLLITTQAECFQVFYLLQGSYEWS